MKRYRFEIDLSKGQPLEESSPPPAEDSLTLSSQLPTDPGLRPPRFEVVDAVPPEPTPPPPAKPSPETVRVYRELRAEIERSGGFVIRRQADNERLEELTLDSDGSVARRVYERVRGPQQNLAEISSLAGLAESHFAAWPGYELRGQLYTAENGVLQYSRLEMVAWVQGRLERKLL